MLIWNKEMECLKRNKLEELQLSKLKKTVAKVYYHVPHYRAKMDAIGLKPQHIQTLKDLALLPFTVKDDLRANYPFGLFAEPRENIVRVHASSGTTGKPIVVGYTQNDINNWTELVARMVTQAGITNHDIAQIAFSYGLFTGGFGLHYGLEKVGAMVVPISGGNTEKQLMLMQDFGTTTLIATPSYSLHVAEVAAQMGLDMMKLKLRTGLFGGEPWTNEMRVEIEKRLCIIATDNYGLSEVIGPGVAGECTYATGMHIAEDHFIAETINPETGEVLPPGSEGELVFTSLEKEAFPVLRYRTKDLSVINQDPCACGRTSARMRKISGRADDMLIIRGVNVFPSQIESVLMTVEGIGPHYQINLYKKGYLDEIEVMVELADSSLLERYKELEVLSNTLRQKLYNVLGLNAKVRLVEPFSITRSPGKAQRVVDKRGQTV